MCSHEYGYPQSCLLTHSMGKVTGKVSYPDDVSVSRHGRFDTSGWAAKAQRPR